ncbi:helix-turn-helix domain-containing protein [Streptomyces bacillaris]|uniref:helix-turn-helix domain-containing protein n=1 Tax=Streptomyces griseus TaxID=1911 RepID=UPI0036AB72D1
MRAAELLDQGRSGAEIARMLGVSDESVRRWRRVWEKGGADALRRRPAIGSPPKLDDIQVERVRTALEQGAQAHGFEADLWTLERVGLVVEVASTTTHSCPGPSSPTPASPSTHQPHRTNEKISSRVRHHGIDS